MAFEFVSHLFVLLEPILFSWLRR